jgi:hypothetical protein
MPCSRELNGKKFHDHHGDPKIVKSTGKIPRSGYTGCRALSGLPHTRMVLRGMAGKIQKNSG